MTLEEPFHVVVLRIEGSKLGQHFVSLGCVTLVCGLPRKINWIIYHLMVFLKFSVHGGARGKPGPIGLAEFSAMTKGMRYLCFLNIRCKRF